MRSIFKVCLANFKRNKTQKVLIAITVLLASLVFSLGISILSIIDKPFDKMYKDLNASHTLLFYDSVLNKNKDVEAFWKSQKEVESTYLVPAQFMQGNAYFNKKIDISLFIAEVPDGTVTQDILKIVEGTEGSKPGVNEIWLPTTFAYENKINVGDSIDLPTFEGSKKYKVSAIIIDPQYSSPQHNPVRVWVKSGELNRIFTGESTSYVIGIRYLEYSEKDEVRIWNDFETYLGQSFTGYKLDYNDIVFKYTSTQESIGAIMLVLALIVIAVCFILIFFAISNSIMSDYTTIGIFKAQGFSSVNIIFTYVLQYLTIGFIAIPLGSMLSIPIVGVLSDSLMKALGMTQSSGTSLDTGIVTFIVLMLFTVGVSFVAASKTSKVKPSQAIRYGAPASKNLKRTGISLSALRRLPVSMMIGIKDTFSQVRQMIFFVIVLFVTSVILVFSFVSISSMENALEDPNYMGMDYSDLTVGNSNRTEMTNDDIYQLLSKEENVEFVVPMNYLINSSIFISDDSASKNIVGTAYAGDMELLGITNSEGRNPSDQNEVSISYKLSQRLNMGIGDTLLANIEGENKELKISGVFSTMSSGGYMFRILNADIKTSKIGMQRVHQVKLKENVDVAKFEQELKGKYEDSLEIVNNSRFRDTFLSSIKSVIKLVTYIISIVVVSVCFITVFNAILINILNMKKNYGIYKSFGMSSFEIRKALIYRIQFVTIIGCGLGIVTAVLLTPSFIGPALSQGGAVRIDIVMDWFQIIMIAPLCMAVTMLSTWVASGGVLKINPRNLVSE
ncbi:FtsX-like permease family protein [Paenibacillus sp. FSL R7-0337]|uniref:ABC transporter permease n=1 Tax=Paenibacillus sp. FSL R7-0337 TaxID=1926588 RepID=UPI00096ECC87|nr:FtsX-like permease family protein [Paenibacillus sp. FSL R7-0337]OMF91672.1 hypothetical protein BK147_20975 [Paenibacillus sp. FSL R7-0337]